MRRRNTKREGEREKGDSVPVGGVDVAVGEERRPVAWIELAGAGRAEAVTEVSRVEGEALALWMVWSGGAHGWRMLEAIADGGR